jgi:dTDP-4-dehydrorhamnose 3,5-epimerase
MFERLAIPEVFLFTPKRHGDARGYFAETFSRAKFDPMVGPMDWLQDNIALSAEKGVLRGLHFQIPPYAQDKLVRCGRGVVLDVAVDLRRTSATYGRYVKAVLSEENGVQIFVPKGFAHAYLTLTANCEVAYKVTAPYHPESERGVMWNDPALAIDWGLDGAAPTLSDRDRKWAPFADLPEYF